MHIPANNEATPALAQRQLYVSSFISPPLWRPNVKYPPGAVVGYQGTIWRCESAHTSEVEPAGAPSANFALWTPIGLDGPSPVYTPLATCGQEWASPPNNVTESDGQEKVGLSSQNEKSAMFATDGKVGGAVRDLAITEEDQLAKSKEALELEVNGKKFWRVGGVGMWSYGLDNEQEKRKETIWREWSERNGRDDWLKIARERTAFYNEVGEKQIKPIFSWKLVNPGERLPPNALPIGNEQDGAVLYASRAWYEGGVHLGKAGHHLIKGASVSHGGNEIVMDTYEVLCGPIDEPHLVKWMTFSHGQTAHVDGWQPIEGGREKYGTSQLLIKGIYENGQHPGKVTVNDDHACIGHDGGELWIRPFQVLAYADPNRR